MDHEDALEAACGAYQQAEHAYLTAVAAGADDRALQPLIAAVVEAADNWESADHEAPPLPHGVHRYYDLPEVMATLWRDLAQAHERRLGI